MNRNLRPALRDGAIAGVAIYAVVFIVLTLLDRAPMRPLMPTETITREIRVIHGRDIECIRREDHVHQRSSLSC